MWRAIPQAKLPCGWLQLRQPNGEPAWVHLASAVYSLSRPVSIPEEASLDSTVPLPPIYEAALRQVRGDVPAAAAGEGAVGGGGDGKTGGGNGGGGGGGAPSSVSQPRAFAHRVPSSLQWLVSQPSSRQEQDRERRGETQSSQRLDTGAVRAEAGAERRPHWSDTQRHKRSCSASGSHTSTPSILASRVAGAPTVVGPARRRRGGGRERHATERRRRRVGDRRQAARLAAHRVGRQGDELGRGDCDDDGGRRGQPLPHDRARRGDRHRARRVEQQKVVPAGGRATGAHSGSESVALAPQG